MTARARPLFLDHAGGLGGGELALLDIARSYRDRGAVVLLSDGPFRHRLAAEGVSVSVIEGGPTFHGVRRKTRRPPIGALWQLLRLAWRVARLARGYDAIHANSQKAFLVGSLASVLARRPLIWELHDVLSADHFSQLNRRIGVLLTNHVVDRVVANSRASADALMSNGGRPDRIAVVYNGIDPAPFDSIPAAAIEATRTDLRLEPGPVLGVFGRLAEWKGQHVAIEALALVPDTQLLVVGDALFGEDEYARRLVARATELGIAHRIRFLGFRSDIPRLMRLSNVILHTSVAPEPFGRVIVEGMMAARPVVATRGGGVAEIIEDGVTGRLVPPGDAAVLAATVQELLGDPERAERLATAGRAKAIRDFTVDAMIRDKTHHIEAIAHR
jgi:glycosyltransferase involved in cell wall biosynthesis